MSSELNSFKNIKEIVNAVFEGKIEPSIYTAINTVSQKPIQILADKDMVTIKEEIQNGWFEVQIYHPDGTVENLVENH